MHADSTKSTNTVWHHATVTRERREHLNGHRGAVIWLTGLSGAGKSTLAHEIEERLQRMGCRTFVFDGDNVRHGLCGDLGFSEQDRSENIRRVGEMVEVYRVQGRFAEAEQEYRRQIQAEPDRPLLRNELGIALIGQRRFNEALQEFSEAIRIDPAYAMAYANRGVVNVELHQLDDAVRDFRKALELEPKNSGFHAKLGFAWFQLGRVDDAIAEYDEALRLDPGNEQARRNRSYIMVGRPSPGPRGAP